MRAAFLGRGVRAAHCGLGGFQAPTSLVPAVWSSSRAPTCRAPCRAYPMTTTKKQKKKAAAAEAAVTAAADTQAPQVESFTAPSPVLDIDESEYQPQLDRKLQRLKELFSSLCPPGESLPNVEVFTSDKSHYRQRAEFTVWGTSNKASQEGPPDVHFVMYDSKSGIKPPPRVRVDKFPVGSKLINNLMQVVTAAANTSPELRERLFQVNFHTALSGESMVTLLYHKKLDDVWQEAAKKLRTQLAQVEGTNGHTPHVIGRSRKQKINMDQDYITERLQVNGQTYTYRQLEGSFSQPNAGVCQHMLSWAQNVTTPAQPADAPAATDSTNHNRHDHELLELYCGNGNFTIPLARNFRRVVATELAKTGVEAAKHNITANNVDNIFVARMSSEEFSEAWATKATKKRLEGMGDWDALNLKTVLVDPPRSGLDDKTVKLLQDNFDNIVYISCNPETLLANLKVLIGTHKVDKFAAFDQFPYTHHLECGVYLTRRT